MCDGSKRHSGSQQTLWGLLLEKIPEACGYRVEQLSQLLKALAACKKELMDVVAIYRDHVAVSVRRALGLGHQDAYQDVRETASRWANCFSRRFYREPDRRHREGTAVQDADAL